jgi:hypothetical protein
MDLYVTIGSIGILGLTWSFYLVKLQIWKIADFLELYSHWAFFGYIYERLIIKTVLLTNVKYSSQILHLHVEN